MPQQNKNAEKRAILAHRYPGTPAPLSMPPRAAWIAGAAVACLFGMVAAFGTVQTSPEPPLTQTLSIQSLALEPAQEQSVDAADFWSEERFHNGDTLAALLDRLGVDEGDIDVLRRFPGMPFRALRPGAIVQARVAGDGELRSLSFISSRDRLVTIDRDGSSFRISEQAVPLTRGLAMKTANIRSSLFAATDAADIPDTVAAQLADIFAGDIDFHRDLRQGDRISVVYEVFSYSGRDIRSGRVLAAEIVNQSKSSRAFWYSDSDAQGQGGYYTAEGKSLRKAFLRSPLEFSRISSVFGMRMHPIQQRWRAHTGVDFAAPEGTRVKATAEGIVSLVARQAGYGNVIELRHSNGLTTLYGHLSGFARGLHPGMRVSQGDVIGFVGQTGWATGPHLHYEFRVNNQFRNPLKMAFPAAQPLSPDKVRVFAEHARPLVAQLDMLRETNIALLE